MFVAWVVLPLLLGVLALGCGLLVEAASRVRLPGAILLPTGLALIIVAAGFTTMTDATAELSAPLVIALAVAGFALSSLERFRGVDWWATGTAVAAFAAFASPIVLSGDATFAGYQRLDDTGTWLAITDHIMGYGRNIDAAPPSTYRFFLDSYIAHGYPVGSFLPLGIGHAILGTDVAWLFQSSVAFMASMLALAIYVLAGQVLESRPLRAVVAFIAAQPAILFAYSLWGGIKEVASAWILVTVAALLVPLLRERTSLTAVVPAAVATAAAFSIMSFGAALWLLIPLLGALALVILQDRETALLRTATFTGVALVLSIPTLVVVGSFIGPANDVLTSSNQLGILREPLDPLQVLGIWPTGDPRLTPSDLGLTHLLLELLVVGLLAGLAVAALKRAWVPLLYFSGAAVGCLTATALGSPWLDGKAFAIASPAAVAFALIGALAAFQASALPLKPNVWIKLGGAVVAVAVATGVIWSTVLAYSGVDLAPRDRLGELQSIGDRIAHKGPTLTTDVQPYGADHFLRTSATDRFSVDIDQLRPALLLKYNLLVIRRSPLASRPPSAYELASRGPSYELWRKRSGFNRRTIEHLALGDRYEPTAKPSCEQIQQLATRTGRGGLLAAVKRPPAIVMKNVPRSKYPSDWGSAPGRATTPEATIHFIFPDVAGTLQTDVELPSQGRWGVWLGGSFRRRFEARIDGQDLAAKRHRLNGVAQFEPMGEADLSAGRHRLSLTYSDKDLRPGSGNNPLPLGPIILSRTTADSPVTLVRPSRATSLCGQSLDWVEALGAQNAGS